ncbi:ABC-type Fe3+-siderophore transport system, permease 2 component [Lachnospiraceae bacterium KM106-2]|nr:ABC-type Fe3+-siderophore transport system, permease 2 component [Lachnospiraceae bacterium KM106-2]
MILHIRLVRSLSAVIVGMALAITGVIIQTILNNPLAGPNIVGINAGAGLGFIIASILFGESMGLPLIGAFAGAMITIRIVLAVSRKIGASRKTTILTGVAVNSLCNAFIDGILVWVPESLAYNQYFKMGSFSGVSFEKLGLPAILIIITMVSVILLHNEMDVLKMGDEIAKGLGLATDRWRNLFLIGAAILVGASVCITGILGFIGLIVPHMGRVLVGEQSKPLLIVSMLLGGIFTLLCDTAARMIFQPYEIPVGILISFIGGGFFIWLLFHHKGERYVDS